MGALPTATTAPSSRSRHSSSAAALRVVPSFGGELRARPGRTACTPRRCRRAAACGSPRWRPSRRRTGSAHRRAAPRGRGPRRSGVNDEVAYEVDHAAGVDHPDRDLADVGGQPREVRLGADGGEGLAVDRRAVLLVLDTRCSRSCSSVRHRARRCGAGRYGGVRAVATACGESPVSARTRRRSCPAPYGRSGSRRPVGDHVDPVAVRMAAAALAAGPVHGQRAGARPRSDGAPPRRPVRRRGTWRSRAARCRRRRRARGGRVGDRARPRRARASAGRRPRRARPGTTTPRQGVSRSSPARRPRSATARQQPPLGGGEPAERSAGRTARRRPPGPGERAPGAGAAPVPVRGRGGQSAGDPVGGQPTVPRSRAARPGTVGQFTSPARRRCRSPAPRPGRPRRRAARHAGASSARYATGPRRPLRARSSAPPSLGRRARSHPRRARPRPRGRRRARTGSGPTARVAASLAHSSRVQLRQPRAARPAGPGPSSPERGEATMLRTRSCRGGGQQPGRVQQTGQLRHRSRRRGRAAGRCRAR